MDFGSARVVGHEANFHERLFLEAWFSIRDPQSGNDHITIPEVYKSLARAKVSRYVFKKVHAEYSSACARRAVFESRVLTLFFQLMKAKAPAETF